jgi:hypothetical protein
MLWAISLEPCLDPSAVAPGLLRNVDQKELVEQVLKAGLIRRGITA